MSRPKAKGVKPNELYNSDLYLQAQTITHERKIYGIFDMLGDIGGVTEFLIIMFGILLLPLAEHFFILDATKQVFMAKTRDEALFARSKKTDQVTKEIKSAFETTPETMEELMKHKYIKLKLRDKLLLFCDRFYGFSLFHRFWANRQ